MTVIAKLLSFVRTTSNDANVTDVNIDSGGGNNKTAQHFSDPGDDSFPLVTDYVLASDTPRNGSKAAHGYLDPINAGVAQEGDKRIYARDPSDGSNVCQVWLKSTGNIVIYNSNVVLEITPNSILGSNDNGAFELQPGGNFVANGAIMKTDGDVITSDNVSLRLHKHVGNMGSLTSAPIPS